MKYQLNKEYTKQSESSLEEQQPSLFHVLLHNDDFTPKEFVVDLLEKFFFMDRAKAAMVMMEAHIKGMVICGAYAKDFAESKVSQVIDYARTHQHPLICTMEDAV